MKTPDICPTCNSPRPHLFPGGVNREVSNCTDEFHDTITPENTPELIAKRKAFWAQPTSLVERPKGGL